MPISIKIMSKTTILTQITLEKGKTILYLALKQKPFAEKVMDEVKSEVEKRLEKYLLQIMPKLENATFKDPEQTLKIIILNGIINILKEMIKEDLLQLTTNDFLILYDLLKNEQNIEDNNNEVDNNPKNHKKEINKENADDKKTKHKNTLDSFLSMFGLC